jgi:NACHT conflict system protein
VARALRFNDACVLLGSEAPVVTRIKKLMGLAAAVAAAPHVQALAAVTLLKDAQQVTDHAAGLLKKANERLGRVAPHERHELLVAAHAITVTTAFFEAFHKCGPAAKHFELLREDQLAIAARAEDRDRFQGPDLVAVLLETEIPVPSPYVTLAAQTEAVRERYRSMAGHLARFIQGLAPWDGLTATDRSRLYRKVEAELADSAVAIYERRLPELAAKHADYFAWLVLDALAASDRAMAGLGTQLTRYIEARGTPGATALGLAKAYRGALCRPMLPVDESLLPDDLTAPTLGDGYIEPAFRLAQATASAQPGDEQWWAEHTAPRDDLLDFLARYLASPAAAELPLVVVGHPGAGKSQLSKVVAARLPEDRFVPVRVELGQTDRPGSVHEQIEDAIHKTALRRCDWGVFSDEAVRDRVMPVVFLDGLDELPHAPGEDQSKYLGRVKQFQQDELDQDRPVAVIVTTRMVIASDLAFPRDCAVVKLEPFDERRVRDWVSRWNEANRGYFRQADGLDPEAVLRYRQLAEQPLLLYMLALHDSVRRRRRGESEPISIVQLYDSVLTLFVEREIERESPAKSKTERDLRVTRELGQLSIFAFSIFNRDARSVTAAEMEGDARALSGGAAPANSDDWSAEQAIQRFFFVHRSWSDEGKGEGKRQASGRAYEFVHATFGEYLVADKCLRLLRGGGADSGPDEADAELFALLSFTPLTNIGQIVVFLCDLAHEMAPDERDRLAARAHGLFTTAHQAGTATRDERYRPKQCSTVDRHLCFSLNMLILLLAVRKPWYLPLVELMRPAGVGANHEIATRLWSRIAQLWRSQLLGQAWDRVLREVLVGSLNEEGRGKAFVPVVRLAYRGPFGPSVPRPRPLGGGLSHIRGGASMLRAGWERGVAAYARRDAAFVLDPYLHALAEAADGDAWIRQAYDLIEQAAAPDTRHLPDGALFPALPRVAIAAVKRLQNRNLGTEWQDDLRVALELLNHVQDGNIRGPVFEIIVGVAGRTCQKLDDALISGIAYWATQGAIDGWLSGYSVKTYTAMSLALLESHPKLIENIEPVIHRSGDRTLTLELMALIMDHGALAARLLLDRHPIDDVRFMQEAAFKDPRLFIDAFRLAAVLGDEGWYRTVGLPSLVLASDKQIMRFSFETLDALAARLGGAESHDAACAFALRVIGILRRTWGPGADCVILARAPALAEFGGIVGSSEHSDGG